MRISKLWYILLNFENKSWESSYVFIIENAILVKDMFSGHVIFHM